MFEDDISPEEEALYSGYAVSQPVSRALNGYDYIDQYAPNKRKASYMLQENDADADEDNRQEEAEIDEQRFSGSAKQVTANDDEIDKDPLMQNMDFLVPVRRIGEGRRVVPQHIQSAAATLLDACSNEGGNFIALNQSTRTDLMKQTGHVDEYAQIDPLVVISCSLSITDSFRAYLEESIPFSEYILLRLLKARFQVRINNTIRTQPIPYEDPDLGLQVRPFEGEETTRGQPFGVEESLAQVSNSVPNDRWIQIRGYMLSLGKLSPKNVCDPQFIEDQIGIFEKIISGQTVIVRKRNKK